MSTVLELKNVHTPYGPVEALKGVSLSVSKGEIVTLIGANGAGKSTLLGTICGDPRASSGEITYEGGDITNAQTWEIVRNGVAHAPEGRRIFSGLTVEENLSMGGFFAPAEQNVVEMQKVFELFPRLRERRAQRGGTLSGGEQQMLAIGRALMSKPRLLLLDEPSLGLAPQIIAQIFQIIESIRDEGVTVFLVEQNANRALQLADRGYVMENGEIVLEDSGDALLANQDVKKAYLGG
jgi:branched-chain amino acid transport system ATP-binding protein